MQILEMVAACDCRLTQSFGNSLASLWSLAFPAALGAGLFSAPLTLTIHRYRIIDP
jgi:hypothetical protein